MVSRITLVAAASMLLGAAMTPAKAADLGKGGVSDLEDRVAELEATVARKGNRVVTLQLYGTVAKGLLIWDDGNDSDAYVVDNDAITTILGFKGEAQINPGLKAGYKIELGVSDSSSAGVSATDDEGDGGATLSIRQNNVYIESSTYGRFTIGQQSTASDGAAEISLANTLIVANPDHTPNFDVVNGRGTVQQYAADFDGGRDDLIRYDSPSVYGFILSAAWGDDNYYDVALRFAKEFNSVKVAAGIAYAKAEDDNVTSDLGTYEQVVGSISVMHVPTGLFANFAAGQRDNEDTDVEGSFYFAQAGIERKFFSYGATTLYGEYGNYEDITFEGTSAELWGLGVVQHIDAAAMDLYAQARFWSFEDDALAGDPEDVSSLMIGAKIDF
ncbi:MULTISPECIES: porin [Rhodomicrobium]|uniref:porin n=1 Tax=Rhodomicrobium TaxID=1068 RepID=UPI000B4B206C|nr:MULTISPECIES: porin [Rhodomicrobium]